MQQPASGNIATRSVTSLLCFCDNCVYIIATLPPRTEGNETGKGETD